MSEKSKITGAMGLKPGFNVHFPGAPRGFSVLLEPAVSEVTVVAKPKTPGRRKPGR